MRAVAPVQSGGFYRLTTNSIRVLEYSASPEITTTSAAGAEDTPQVVGEFRRRGVTPLRFRAEAPEADSIHGDRERRPDGGGRRNGSLGDPQPLQERGIPERQATRDGLVQDRPDPMDVHGGA